MPGPPGRFRVADLGPCDRLGGGVGDLDQHLGVVIDPERVVCIFDGKAATSMDHCAVFLLRCHLGGAMPTAA